MMISHPSLNPARYVCDEDGKALVYKLNGVRVLVVSVAAVLLLHFYAVVDLGLVVANFHSVVLASFIVGMLASLAFYFKGLSLPASVCCHCVLASSFFFVQDFLVLRVVVVINNITYFRSGSVGAVL